MLRDRFAEDVRAPCSLAGHLHEHQARASSTCWQASGESRSIAEFNFARLVDLPFADEDGRTGIMYVRTDKESLKPLKPEASEAYQP